jgi:WD40 repeat protein
MSVWNSTTFQRIAVLEGHTGKVTLVAWSRDGKRFASGGSDGAVRLWDVETWNPLRSLTSLKGPVTALAWAPDGGTLAAAASDKSVKLWTAEGEEKTAFTGHTQQIASLAWAPKGGLLASGGRDRKIMIWNQDTGELERTIACPSSAVALDWTMFKGISALACGMQDGGAKIFNSSTGAEITTVIDGSPSWPYGFGALAWSPGARPGLLTSRWYLAQLWDVNQRDSVSRQIAPGGSSNVLSAAGGKLVVVRALDRTTRVWEHNGNVVRCALLDDGGTLAAITPVGDVACDPDVSSELIAIVEAADGHQKTLSLLEFKSSHGWKSRGHTIKLPAKN